ncbi:ABC transporter ATP-binding protein [Lachnoclostridium sp. Marseille-P6806]|uniref:ABC transporter ATP-binding protein n=1 Tax=Lachnoclostridium sp. Marseille-P6806 TaxID=2364793 RepID=UPI001030F76A|nr:energy-coupling factor ABC transporter ATP-binding protein [Lachnoclostridium sp. Marseille-P6806]
MIELQNVSFAYDESEYGGVRNVSLKIKRGECILLSGASGCGKTTITRLVNGLIPHFYHGKLSGRILVNGMDTQKTEIAVLSNTVGTVFQNPRTQFFNTDTDSEIVFGLENRGVSREELLRRLSEITEELDLHSLRSRSIFELSGGEKQKIAFSSVYAAEPDILVFDEPSSNLDMKSIGELSQLIRNAKNAGKTILIAEHRFWYLMDIVDRVVYMKGGEIVSDMPISAFLTLPESDMGKMGLRVRNLSLSEQGGMRENISENHLSVEDIHVRLGGRDVLKGASFLAGGGEIIAIAGLNGAGKTTLARAICGLQKNIKGNVFWNGHCLSRRMRRGKAYMVMQDVGHQLFTESVLSECTLGIKNPDIGEIEKILNKVDLLEYKERHPLSLSGGQMQRLSVAVSEICGKELLVFDEPTSGLDLKSMEEVGEIARMLAGQDKVILIITHDIEFMKKICTRILFIRDGKIERNLEGEAKEEIIDLLGGKN